jgi:hypothetical protein
LVAQTASYRTSYIEAGEIHLLLWKGLKAQLPASVRFDSYFLMTPVVKRLSGKRRLFAPGDVLTLRYIFHPNYASPEEDLLAARSLVYNKLIEKQEIGAEAGFYPHTLNEVETIRTVEQLSLEDCRALFGRIRLAASEEARAVVGQYLVNR